MSRVVYQVEQKNGSFVSPRLESSHHSTEGTLGFAEVIIGGVLFFVAAGFVLFVLIA